LKNIFLQKIPALRRILIQNFDNQNKEEILKTLQNKIFEIENEICNFHKNHEQNKNQILSLFSNVN